MHGFFARYLLPGLIFQSVIISGGYSTGRELVEFFMGAGPVAGITGMLFAMVIWSIILSLTFEYARVHRAYDYRSFFRALLGRGWILFEISYVSVAMLALAIIGAASGVIFADMSGAPSWVGTVMMMTGIGILVFHGSALIEKILSFWSFVLYAAYITLFVMAFNIFGDGIVDTVNQQAELAPDWHNALKYAGINLAAVPAIFFCIVHIKTRREAVCAGLLAGPIAMLPALLFYIVLLSQYPQVLTQEVPLISLLNAMHTVELALLFKIVIFGTYIETGTAVVHSINERIAGLFREKKQEMSHRQRVLVAALLLFVSIYLATKIGLIDLIGKGYGTITYLILAIYLLPLVTIGIRHILRAPAQINNEKEIS